MTSSALDYQSLALAGIVQASAMVQRTARGRSVTGEDLRVVCAAVVTRNATDLSEIFPHPHQYLPGIKQAMAILSGQEPAPEVPRYTLQLIDIAGRLRRNRQVVHRLGEMLDRMYEREPDPAALASIYRQTISTLGKRIQVIGEPGILQQDSTADRIRAMLLGGVRYAWLWHQVGGRRWHLLLRRKTLTEALRGLEHQIMTQAEVR